METDSETKQVDLGGSKALKRLKFTLHDKDLSEKFVKGFGPGG